MIVCWEPFAIVLLLIAGLAIADDSNIDQTEDDLTDDQVKYLAADYAEFLYGVRGDYTWPSAMARTTESAAVLSEAPAVNEERPVAIRKRAPQQRFCGARLIELVTKVCDGCLAPPTGTQRVKPRSSRPGDNPPMPAPSRTKRAGLATKCCHNTCEIDDIKAYCCKK